jgi:hypothetical protein
MSRSVSRQFRPGDIVRVDGDRSVWKVLAVVQGLAHLTKLLADPRLDWRDVTVDRLALAEGVLS